MNQTDWTVSRRSFLASVGAVSAAAVLPGSLASAAGGLLARARGPLMKWETTKGGIRYVADLSFGGNTAVLASGDEAVLIDTKYAYLGSTVLHDVRAIAENDSVKITLINTHHHGDHTGGNPVVVPQTESYAHPKAIERTKGMLERYKSDAQGGPSRLGRIDAPEAMLKLAMKDGDASASWDESTGVPEHAITERETALSIGGERVRVYHFGAGHTDNDLVVHFPDHNVVHTGDLVFNGTHPYMDVSGGVDPSGWVRSLNDILMLCDSNTVVIPGHGPVADRSIVKTQLGYFRSLREEVQRAVDDGKSKEETQAMEWAFMKDLGFGTIRPIAIGVMYDDITK